MAAFPNYNLLVAEKYPKLFQMAVATKESLKAPLGRLKPQEKMPPRFNTKGMSVAVRVLGHEIRHFTHKTTGKDLATLRQSCPYILKRIGQVAKESKFSFTKFHIPMFELPNSNLNEMDFNGNYVSQYLDSVQNNRTSNLETDFEAEARIEKDDLLYSWNKNRITEKELQRLKSLVSATEALFEKSKTDEKEKQQDDWKLYMQQEKFRVWRKKLQNGGPYVFRIHGSYEDISAQEFFQTQVDIQYRFLWDSYAQSMNVVAKDHSSESEIVRWLTKCPYPMNSREYLFIRNSKVYEEDNVAVLVSRATEHPEFPETKEFVRVPTYESQMAIKPFTDFEKNGMEFVLVYCDDPQTVMPSYLIDMITSSGKFFL